MPAGVCISSLLANAREETRYGIYIQYNPENLRPEEQWTSELKLWSTMHYTGDKLWNSPCLRGDIWWEYYRRSPFFDAGFYYRQTMSYICLGRYSFLSLAKHLTLRMIGKAPW